MLRSGRRACFALCIKILSGLGKEGERIGRMEERKNGRLEEWKSGRTPSILPFVGPSFHPSVFSAIIPSFHPSILPSFRPSFHPSILPSFLPFFLTEVDMIVLLILAYVVLSIITGSLVGRLIRAGRGTDSFDPASMMEEAPKTVTRKKVEAKG
jgi:hypothetical protein